MPTDHSVSHWLRQVQAGDHGGIQPLWDRYFAQLVRLARARLRGVAAGHADEEDVAASAFASFCRAAEAGRFPQLGDRDDLWRLLIVITARKAARVLRSEMRAKRGGGLRREDIELESVVGDAPSPAFAAQCADECRAMLALLGDETLAAVAVQKMEGYSAAEIAGRCDVAVRTVERKLQLIRQIWEAAEDP